MTFQPRSRHLYPTECLQELSTALSMVVSHYQSTCPTLTFSSCRCLLSTLIACSCLEKAISSKSFSRSPWNLRGISNISETEIGEMTLMALISCSKTWSTRTRFYAIRYSIQSSRFLQKYCQGPIGLLFSTLRWTRSSESLRRSMRVRTHQRLT